MRINCDEWRGKGEMEKQQLGVCVDYKSRTTTFAKQWRNRKLGSQIREFRQKFALFSDESWMIVSSRIIFQRVNLNFFRDFHLF